MVAGSLCLAWSRRLGRYSAAIALLSFPPIEPRPAVEAVDAQDSIGLVLDQAAQTTTRYGQEADSIIAMIMLNADAKGAIAVEIHLHDLDIMGNVLRRSWEDGTVACARVEGAEPNRAQGLLKELDVGCVDW